MEINDELICNFETSAAYVHDLNNTMNTHNFMLCYKGNFSQNMIKSILAMTEKKMNNSEEDVIVKKKVFNVLVECLQNISKSSVMIEGTQSLLMIGKVDDNYEIYSGNVIANSKKNELEQILNSIAISGKEELKNFYKLLMVNNTLFNINSIEVALIDIAKKTGNRMEFEFKDLDESTSFFTLKTIVARYK